MSKTNFYEVYAIKYAHHEREASLNFMDPPDIHAGHMPIDYFVWLICSKNQKFLVDTGFNIKTGKKRGRKIIRCPTQALALMNVKATQIENIIITHLHYDHVGNYDLFPQATFHIQEREMAFATGPNMLHTPFRRPMDVEHICGMVRQVFDDRVVFYNGSCSIEDGLEVHLIGGHTAGLQCVRVMTKRGWVVLASDASHLYANFERVNPYPIIFREDEMLDGFKVLKNLATSPDHIIPGHDPLVMKRYPSPNLKLQGIVARLDEVGPNYE